MYHSFEYHRPSSLEEACALLRDLGSDAIPMAGGTDVLVDLRRGSRDPRHIVSLADLTSLSSIEMEGESLRVGALVTPAQLARSETVRINRPELLDSVGVFGTPQVRNRATVGGSLCTAASCGDLAPLLLALGARIVVQAPEARRTLSMEGFFEDHRRVHLGPGELLVEVAIPVRRPEEGAAYQAFGLRAASFITAAGVAVLLRLEAGQCARARIALGAVAPTPVLAHEAADALEGHPLEDTRLRQAAILAREVSLPISDVRGSADHRRELVEELCFRALAEARGRAR